VVIPEKFSRQAFETSSSPNELANQLCQVVRAQLEPAADRLEVAYFVVQSLRALGHDLYSWDESSDSITWGDDYVNPPSPLRFLIEMRWPVRDDLGAGSVVEVCATFGPWPRTASD
jgi:hypothetical protein